MNVQSKRILLLAALVLATMAGLFLVSRALAPKPELLGQTHGGVSRIRRQGDSWYWLEAAGTPGAKLMRASGAGPVAVTSADGMSSYATAEGKLVWNAHAADGWKVMIGGADGSGKRELSGGRREPKGLCVADGRVFWLEEIPPLIPESEPIPPLSGTVQVMSAALEGGSPTTLGTVLETNGMEVVGVHNGQVYVSALRAEIPIVTTVYQVPLAGGVSHRIVGETGPQDVLLTRSGTLYWTAPSQEATHRNRIVCVRRLGKDNKPETLTDWISSDGHLSETERGVCYVDGSI